ncbi:hypothetical protein KY290_030746 [Solanum tuberosum]|uniref:Uncharacterized protein n=1 Tax=Solanum tuberosum TaxID=4113 RepID=A0ABQ7U7K5_SOLTU|nr:hypothetical protein KY289_029988 [Solanum tuberosum]KAH0742753.1 hypothetical protein KY290_030746 [Solanum tuberosum]
MTMFIWNFPMSGDANASNNSKEFFQGPSRLIDLKQDQHLQLDNMMSTKSGITIMGICTIITLLSPVFSTGKYRSFRAVLFMSMGFFGLIPAVHAVVLNWDEPERNVTLAYELAMALSYLIGTMFYIMRIPERWRPGFFDLAGHSHQIFHVFVILGALSHYGAALVFLEYRSRLRCDT